MEIEKSKLVGFAPINDIEGKLKKQKGVKVIGENYGMALFPSASKKSPKFEAVRMFNVCRKTERERLREANGGKFPDILRKGHLISTKQGSYAGQIWRILSVEETGRVRFCHVDIPRRVDKPKENFETIMISSLMRDSLQILRPRYTGITVCPTTSSA